MFYSYHNRFQIQSIAIAGATISLAVGLFQPAQAALITYDFNVTITDVDGTNASGTLPASKGKVFSGSFSYDNEALKNIDPLIKPLYDITNFEFNYLNTTYTEDDLNREMREGPTTGPLHITGGEIVFLPGVDVTLSRPLNGELQSFSFNNFFRPGYGDHFFIVGSKNPAESSFSARFFSEANNIGGASGTVKYALRTEPIPEPDGTLGLVAALGLGWSFKRWFAVRKRSVSKTIDRGLSN